MQIAVDHVQPGMVLAREVRNQRGQTLLAAGTQLQHKHLRVLKTWGVRSVPIIDSETEHHTPQPPSRSDIEAAAVTERRRFQYCDLGNPVVHHCYLAATRRRALRQR